MTDKVLEAAPDAAIVAKAMACSEWPKWLFDLTYLTNRAADEADMSTEQAVAFAVLSCLSALPGEAEVVAWRGRYAHPGEEPEEWSLYHREYRIHPEFECEPLVTLASLQAMQARAEAAEGYVDDGSERAAIEITDALTAALSVKPQSVPDPENMFHPDKVTDHE